ncbi:MAG: type II secretion system protein [Dehalococcoidales bacterium]
MSLPKRGEKGFTLIELLIVVAILGVLAAVVIPNVGRFIGRGEEEAWATELSNVQSAVVAMMVDNAVSTLPSPKSGTGNATNNMSQFPDDSTLVQKGNDSSGTAYSGSDGTGFILYQHDITADAANTSLVNYTATQYTKGTYSVDASGTVEQETTGYE